MSVEELLRRHFPSLDDEIVHYVSGELALGVRSYGLY